MEVCAREVIIQGWAKVGEASLPDLKPHLRKVKLSVLAGSPLSDLFPIRQFVSKIPRLSKTQDFVSHAVCQDPAYMAEIVTEYCLVLSLKYHGITRAATNPLRS
ncbi:hypothetical protein J6590_092651 [Homalodisca vitripennis]|nr:hypothetical protein J6590_092651 [Homalodisca vitripennis]